VIIHIVVINIYCKVLYKNFFKSVTFPINMTSLFQEREMDRCPQLKIEIVEGSFQIIRTCSSLKWTWSLKCVVYTKRCLIPKTFKIFQKRNFSFEIILLKCESMLRTLGLYFFFVNLLIQCPQKNLSCQKKLLGVRKMLQQHTRYNISSAQMCGSYRVNLNVYNVNFNKR